MKVHITNLYGFVGIGAKSQNAVTAVAKKYLGYNELGIYWYPMKSDSPEMLRTRLDGILASVSHGDIVILQSPTWIDPSFDEFFMRRLQNYRGIKKIILVHDIPPLMFEQHRSMLKRYIEFYNRADLLILPSQNMVECLRAQGLTVNKIVVQRMWDYVVSIDRTVIPQFRRVINLAGNPNTEQKLNFTREWNSETVQLAVTVNDGDWIQNKNIRLLGWFSDDNLLVNTLRKSGGFGLMWSDDSYWCEYMKLNATYKLSTYLAAGIPVIVPRFIPEADTIIHKNLGFAVRSLKEALEKIEHMSEEEYKKMISDVDAFSELIRGSFFAKKMLTDAVFRVLND